jgi:predicted type IV restriction endonuclease
MAPDIHKALKKFAPFLLQAQTDNLNEADTVQRVVKFFEEVLGYDVMQEITRETQIKDRYVDLAVKLDGTIKLLIEVKAAGTTLRDRHIDQAERYAAEGNIPWVLLTNGVAWTLYHLTFEEGIEYERAFTVDLASDPLEAAADQLALLHRHAIRNGEHEAFWQRRLALGPASIGKSLFTEEVLHFIRRDLRKREGVLVDEEDLGAAIHDMLSAEARERIGPLKIRRKRTVRPARPAPASTTPPDTSEPAVADPSAGHASPADAPTPGPSTL